ncbi:hypothetical protein E2P81_ATG00708 [Venturia nashicola]|uniref:Uncharacterized protein n=1 Tax=Venturia nashicola TaxID=86259 RepID=A0A4Z1PG87_9PEZI|nr:hypothetical protein E6O75_ATG00720 [Venturia nashicola]TLD39721.1 hypothetical protein E2P81_ATG00708 [Venturia nashicola]
MKFHSLMAKEMLESLKENFHINLNVTSLDPHARDQLLSTSWRKLFRQTNPSPLAPRTTSTPTTRSGLRGAHRSA